MEANNNNDGPAYAVAAQHANAADAAIYGLASSGGGTSNSEPAYDVGNNSEPAYDVGNARSYAEPAYDVGNASGPAYDVGNARGYAEPAYDVGNASGPAYDVGNARGYAEPAYDVGNARGYAEPAYDVGNTGNAEEPAYDVGNAGSPSHDGVYDNPGQRRQADVPSETGSVNDQREAADPEYQGASAALRGASTKSPTAPSSAAHAAAVATVESPGSLKRRSLSYADTVAASPGGVNLFGSGGPLGSELEGDDANVETAEDAGYLDQLGETRDDADEGESAFDPNAFVVDGETANLRVISVRRSNPAYTNSLVLDNDINFDAVDEETA
jgi:hypothetical protein